MTPDEVETCLRDFFLAHKTPPVIIIAGDQTHGELALSLGFSAIDGREFYAGTHLMRDPLIKGIVVSS